MGSFTPFSVPRGRTSARSGWVFTPPRAARPPPRFLTIEPAPTLRLRDFEHLAPQLDAARGILRGAYEAGAVGVNLLVHGPTGCGKTEAVRLLAAEIGAQAYLAGAADSMGNPPNAQERLTSLALVQRTVAKARALVSFDETEDIAPGSTSFFGLELPAPERPSKIWMTRRLEQNPVPTIWLTNRIDALDPAFVRRFALVVHFPGLGSRRSGASWPARPTSSATSTPPRSAASRSRWSSCRAGALGGGWAADALLAEVEQEVRCRGTEGAAIGF